MIFYIKPFGHIIDEGVFHTLKYSQNFRPHIAPVAVQKLISSPSHSGNTSTNTDTGYIHRTSVHCFFTAHVEDVLQYSRATTGGLIDNMLHSETGDRLESVIPTTTTISILGSEAS